MPPIMPNEAFRSRRNTLSSFSLKNKVQYLKRNTNLRRYNSNNSLTNWPLEHECVDRTLNITIVGAPGVGKSALLVRLITGKFIGVYSSAVHGTFEKFYKKNGTKYKVNLRETAGFTEREIEQNITWSDAIIILYSETDLSSIKIAKCLNDRLEKVSTKYNRPCPMTYLVGNKTDNLPDNSDMSTEQECIDLRMACDCWTSFSVKDQYTECFKFFDELISSVTAFKCRHHSVANSLSMSTTSLCSPSESSLDLDSSNRRDTQITRPPRRSKSYGNLPNEVIRSLKKNVYKNGSVKNLFKSLHSPLSQTKSFE